MDRRTFNKLAGLVGMDAFIGPVKDATAQAAPPYRSAAVGGQESVAGREVVLEDSWLFVAFDVGSGALTRMRSKLPEWEIQRRPEWGVSFRMLAPVPHRRDNFVLGQKQRAVEVKKLSDHQVRLKWKNLLSEHGGVLPLTFIATVTLQDGALTFEGTLVNDCAVAVETIDYPYFGDINPPTRDAPMWSEHMWYGNLVTTEIYPVFSNEKGYWGVDFPTKTVASKQSLFCLLQSLDRGIYLEMHDPTQPYLLEFTFEQHPGVVQSINNSVPAEDEISGIPVHLDFRMCHFVFAQPGATRMLAPIVLRCYSGDWHAGVDLYKQWRASWFKQPGIPSWIKDVNSWQQLQIDGAEEDYRIPFRSLGKYVRECAENGVAAIQLVGWNCGGQDRGDPSQDTDPGLGTWQELHDAIAQAQAMGVKMILFGKLNWVDMTTAWFKTELYKYSCTDSYGIPYQSGGYSYTTPTQLAGINNRLREMPDFQCQTYRDIATREFRKILKLGAAGWLFDEVCHHGPVDYSFSPDHGYAPPGYIYGGDLPLAKQMRIAADEVSKDFLFSGEAPQDWLMQYYPVSYFRINSGSRPVNRYIDPRSPLMVAVTGIDDREMLNLILLYRYIISYEPYNFKGELMAFPLTLDYGKKIDALRHRYKSQLWDAEFRDTVGATVSADGLHRHTVFVGANGKRSVIVANEEQAKPITATVNMSNSGKLVTVTPEQPETNPTSGTLQIAARSVAVVMEL